jgi:hypothetical protein
MWFRSLFQPSRRSSAPARRRAARLRPQIAQDTATVSLVFSPGAGNAIALSLTGRSVGSCSAPGATALASAVTFPWSPPLCK